jgi:hypothetical protein
MPGVDEQITTPVTAGLVRGAVELEPGEHGLVPHRLPGWARAQCADPQLLGAQAQPAGVRLALRTAATAVELAALRTRIGLTGVPLRPDGVYDLLVDGKLAAQSSVDGGSVRWTDPATGAMRTEPGPVGTVRFTGLPAGVKDVEIWLPHNEITELVALRTDAPVEPAPATGRRIWLHHGSSISHGSNAASPSTTWPALAAAAGGVDLVNLGLSGSAMADQFTARTMRDLPADLISVKLGINVVNADLMRLRAFGPAVHGFLDTVRDGHPDTPLLVITPILCPIFEDTPGPGAVDLSGGQLAFAATGDPAEVPQGRLTLGTARDEVARIVRQRQATDPNLHLLDGRDLYGPGDPPLPDRLHPDPVSHRLMADRFSTAAFGPDGPFRP